MHQAPRSARGPYGIVGDGRVALHMCHYFKLLDIPYHQWSRKLGRKSSRGPGETLRTCEIVLILITDSAIEPLIEAREFRPNQKLIHFSGSLVTPLAQGMHPLSSFTAELYSLDTYREIPFICEEGPVQFADIFPDLKNRVYTIPREMKPLYHSLCVLGGNFTTLLWYKLFSTFERQLNLPREAAYPYLNQIARNLQAKSTSALTGPLARREKTIIQSDLRALDGDPFQQVYRSFVNAAAPELTEEAV